MKVRCVNQAVCSSCTHPHKAECGSTQMQVSFCHVERTISCCSNANVKLDAHALISASKMGCWIEETCSYVVEKQLREHVQPGLGVGDPIVYAELDSGQGSRPVPVWTMTKTKCSRSKIDRDIVISCGRKIHQEADISPNHISH